MNSDNFKLWPFLEAKKLLKRLENRKKSNCIFQTGYGPSGLPHIGTFGEVLRTSMVVKALNHLSKVSTKLYVFSDDLDGLRKVPQNIPNKDLIKINLEKPLSSIPDPFEIYSSFAEHNNSKLIDFLKRFEFEFEFKSATEIYKRGVFNSGLEAVFENYDKILDIILPTLGKERKESYSPFLPICKKSGKVLQVSIKLDKKKKRVIYKNPDTNKTEDCSIFNGECKLQWKVDWAMRWKVLDVDYEMNGKDLIESFQLSSKINKTIGGTPPCNFTYELFLDENGEKISKSIGNGISVDDWLKFSPRESLELFMFQNLNRAKKLYFDVIPKMTDEFLRFKTNYTQIDEKKKFESPMWFINFDKDQEDIPDKISFNMILNLASVCNAENSAILWGFIENYYPSIDRSKYPLLGRLLEFGVQYFREFVLPNKKYRDPTKKEKDGLIQLTKMLKELNENVRAEEIQTKIYEIGMALNFDNLKDWFSTFYEVILGQNQGPRLGSFIKFYGIQKTVELVEKKIY